MIILIIFQPYKEPNSWFLLTDEESFKWTCCVSFSQIYLFKCQTGKVVHGEAASRGASIEWHMVLGSLELSVFLRDCIHQRWDSLEFLEDASPPVQTASAALWSLSFCPTPRIARFFPPLYSLNKAVTKNGPINVAAQRFQPLCVWGWLAELSVLPCLFPRFDCCRNRRIRFKELWQNDQND